MRFLHLADIHLDTPFAGRSSELRDRLRDASREAFRRAVDVAVERGVHAVLIAGDLLDGERLSLATERFLLDQLRRFDREGITVVYATGNHDPGRPGTGIQRIAWPDNVRIATDARPERVVIRDREGRTVGRVTAAGHETHAVTDDLSVGFPNPAATPESEAGAGTEGSEQRVPEVALLHSQVVGSRASEGHDRYAPSELEALRRAGYDYWALGHVHLRQELSADPPIHYPGNLQGRHPGETGPRGGLLVELDAAGGADVEFVELGPVRWETLNVEGIEKAESLEALVRHVVDAWSDRSEESAAPPGTEWIVRVELRGGSPLWRELGREDDRRALADQLRDALGALHVEVRAPGIHPVVRPDEHRDRSDVVGEAVRLLGDVRNGRIPPPVTWDELARRDPDADREALALYARRLLDGAEGELLARLLVGPDGGGA